MDKDFSSTLSKVKKYSYCLCGKETTRSYSIRLYLGGDPIDVCSADCGRKLMKALAEEKLAIIPECSCDAKERLGEILYLLCEGEFEIASAATDGPYWERIVKDDVLKSIIELFANHHFSYPDCFCDLSKKMMTMCQFAKVLSGETSNPMGSISDRLKIENRYKAFSGLLLEGEDFLWPRIIQGWKSSQRIKGEFPAVLMVYELQEDAQNAKELEMSLPSINFDPYVLIVQNPFRSQKKLELFFERGNLEEKSCRKYWEESLVNILVQELFPQAHLQCVKTKDVVCNVLANEVLLEYNYFAARDRYSPNLI